MTPWLPCLLWSVAGAGDGWVRVRTEHFEIYSDSPREARLAARRFEGFHALLVQVHDRPRPAHSEVPLPVYVFRNEASFRDYRPLDTDGNPKDSTGVFHSRPGLSLITIDASVAEGRLTARHEYVHWVLDNPRDPLPLWFNEGMADFYSTATVTRRGTVAVLGVPHPDRVRTLRQREWLPLSRVLTVTERAPEYNEEPLRRMLYAQSWLIVHRGLTTDDGSLPALLHALDVGHDVDEALRTAYGVPPRELVLQLQAYARRDALPLRTVPLAEPPLWTVSTPEPVGRAEIAARLALIRVLVGQPDAGARLEQAARLDPTSPIPHTGLGLRALARGRVDEAESAFARARQLGATDAATLFGWASSALRLGHVGPDSRPELQQALERAVSLDPDLVAAYHLLADLAADAHDDAAVRRWLTRGLAAAPADEVLRRRLDALPTAPDPAPR